MVYWCFENVRRVLYGERVDQSLRNADADLIAFRDKMMGVTNANIARTKAKLTRFLFYATHLHIERTNGNETINKE